MFESIPIATKCLSHGDRIHHRAKKVGHWARLPLDQNIDGLIDDSDLRS